MKGHRIMPMTPGGSCAFQWSRCRRCLRSVNNRVWFDGVKAPGSIVENYLEEQCSRSLGGGVLRAAACDQFTAIALLRS